MLKQLRGKIKSLWSGMQPSRVKSALPHYSLALEPASLPFPADKNAQATAERFFRLGNEALHSQNLDAAETLFWQALDIHPRFVDVHCNLGALYRDRHRTDLARLHLQLAMRLDPQCAIAAFNLAMSFLDERRWNDALPLLRVAATRVENKAEVLYWTGNALMGIGDHMAAQCAYESAFRLAPTLARARWGYAMAQLPAIQDGAGTEQEAVLNFKSQLERLQKWLSKNKSSPLESPVGAQQPYYLAYLEGNHKDVLSLYGTLCYEEMKRSQPREPSPAHLAPRGTQVRLGIASAHIFEHSVWRAFVKGWVAHMDREAFELHIFHLGEMGDGETTWARKQTRHFHQGPQPWQAWAQAIRHAQLDVLIYPEIGMDVTTLRLAALRLAPSQMVGWGHPITSGLPTMDVYLSAAAFEPPGSDAHYRERLVALEGIGACYQPYRTPTAHLDFKQLNIEQKDVVLICAGTPMKYAAKHDSVFIDITARCQEAKLVFFKKVGDPFFDKFESRLRQAYAARGLHFEDSVRFVPWLPRPEFFALLRRADVYLDSMGFSGFNTAMHALECDLPMIAYEGSAMRGRFASGLLQTMGLHAWVAGTPAAFVEMACRLAQDPEVRKRYRENIASRKGALMNDRASVRQLCDILKQSTIRRP